MLWQAAGAAGSSGPSPGELQELYRGFIGAKGEGIQMFSDVEAPYATAQIVSPHVLGRTSS